MATAEPCTEDTPPPGWPHTPAQWRVARRLALGLSATQIAGALGLSYHTVQMHLARLALRHRPDEADRQKSRR